VDESESIEVLCVDKTGTLTRHELKVTAVQPMAGFDEPHVLGLAALASSDGGQDPVDAAIRHAASRAIASDLPKLTKFVPFDSATKMSEATAVDPSGSTVRAVKGAFAAVMSLTQPSPAGSTTANQLEAQGFRVLAVAVGPPEAVKLAGIIALSDPPRTDSAALITELHTLGVRTVMVTGDAPATAAIVAHAVGLDGAVCPPGPIPNDVRPEDFAVFAGVLPEGKYNLVKAFQKSGHTVGRCGDGANDAPALRQAQVGIEMLRTLAFVVIVFGNQATTYPNRERQRFGSARPSLWLIGSSVVDLLIASTLATCGMAMAPLPVFVVGGTLVAAVVFAVILDFAKVPVFKRLGIA
jgi:H+-transporting ATPase